MMFAALTIAEKNQGEEGCASRSFVLIDKHSVHSLT
jgi:hypothetical protein